MALTSLVTPQTGDTIEAATWVNEFNNIYNNSLSLISPLTGTLNFNNNTLTNLALGSASAPSLYFNSDANTGIYSRTADTFNVTTGSSLALEVGASWILAAAPEDSRTDSVDVVGIIRSTTSGTPAAGIGVGIAFQAESGDENPSTFGRIDFAATDVGAGTEDTYMDILLRVAGVAEETKYRFASTAGTGFQGTFTHAVTADRTWTLPNETGSILTDTGHDVAAAVHGLPASVNVLGNRSAAGEFIQRANLDPAAVGSVDRANYTGSTAVSFAVAFSATPFVMPAGMTDAPGGDEVMGVISITTTGFSLVIHSTLSDANATDGRWVALGS